MPPVRTFLASGKNVAVAINPGASGELTAKDIAWKVTKGLPYVPSPLVYQGYMYTINMQGRLAAHDTKTGKDAYLDDQVGLANVYASPVAANGFIYLCGLDRSLIVMKAGDVPEKVSSTTALPRRPQLWATRSTCGRARRSTPSARRSEVWSVAPARRGETPVPHFMRF